MDEQERHRSVAPAAGLGLIGALVLAGALFLEESPLDSPRTPGRRLGAALDLGPESVDARLWEDPFAALSEGMGSQDPMAPAVENAAAAVEKLVHALEAVLQPPEAEPQPAQEQSSKKKQPRVGVTGWQDIQYQISSKLEGSRASGPSSIALIGVAVPGDTSAESVERRRRERFAVISALGSSGYVPRVGDRISSLTAELETGCGAVVTPGNPRPCPNGRRSPPEERPQARVPFEWFRRDPMVDEPLHPSLQEILVLWLNERAFDEGGSGVHEARLVENTSRLFAGLVGAVPLDRFVFALIGPSDTRTLRRLVCAAFRTASATEASRPASPNELELAPLAQLLVDITSSYLDDTLDEAEKRDLVEALTKEFEGLELRSAEDLEDITGPLNSFRDGLARELRSAGSDVVDLDLRWYDTVAARFTRGLADKAHPSGPLPQGREAAKKLQEELQEYLDLPSRAPKEDVLRNILEPLLGQADLASFRKGGSLAKAATEALRSIRRPLETDKNWQQTVVTRWLGTPLPSRESHPASSLRFEQVRERLSIYSSRATAPLGRLWASCDRDSRHRLTGDCVAREIERGLQVERFTSTVVSDDRLAEVLVEELARWGVNPAGRSRKDNLVLIAEWDTPYGRLLPELIARRIGKLRKDASRDEGATNGRLRGQEFIPGIFIYSYLRGLDGKVPARNAQEAAAQEQGDRARTGRSRPAADDGEAFRRELAEGQSQLDQVRRLGWEIERLSEDLHSEGRGRIRAFGVLGSDLYDKELVLQVLRPRFRDAVFFTTDLDARLWHPQHWRWNRNLLVASSFDVRLHDALQRRVPSFRDSYASASYLAVRAALADSCAANGCTDGFDRVRSDAIKGSLEPRIFKIGRSGPRDLTPHRIEAQGRLELHPRGNGPHRPARTLVWATLLLAATGSAVTWSRRRKPQGHGAGRQPDGSGTGRRTALRVGVAIGLLALIYLVFFKGEWQGAEPFAWIEGISAWPYVLLSLTGILLALILWSHGCASLRRSDAEMARWVGKDARGELVEAGRDRSVEALGESPSAAPWWRRPSELLRLGFSDLFWKAESPEPRAGGQAVSAEEAWRVYREQEASPRRRARVAIGVVALGGSIFVLMLASGAIEWRFGLLPVPLSFGGEVRGLAMKALFGSVTLLSIVILLALACWVLDVTRCCARWIRTLSAGPSRWPRTPAVDDLGLRHGMPADPALNELLAVRLIAERTEVIGRLILFPFFVLVVLLLARSSIFQQWSWPWWLILALGLAPVLAVACGIALRRAANRARELAMRRLLELRSQAFAAKSQKSRSEQITMLLDEVKAIRRGAFGPWTKNPLVAALLLPFGGVSLGILFELLLRFGR